MSHKKTRALERPGSGYPGCARLVHCEPGFYTNRCTEAEWMGWMGTSSTLPLMYGILLIDERGITLSYWRPNCGRFDQARVYCGRISPVIFMFCFFGISSHAAPPKLIQALQDGDRQVPAPFYFTNPLPRGITSLRFFESSSCRPRGCLPRAVFTSPQLSTGALMPTRTSLSCPAPTTTR